ncbi:MAG: V-type ATP synthase subunit C, partial [Candidatus Omnitrophica bacterium]|nr:V-type ATP synthase subunit C [Candidatus Omnitrophota bacterium]
DAIKNLIEQKSFLMLEKAINDFLMETLKPVKYISYGPEPLMAYYFAKTNEINLIRMIILAKLNDVSKDLVKERLNAVYA